MRVEENGVTLAGIFRSSSAYCSGSWQALKDHMRTAGNVARVDIQADQSGNSKGHALVSFADAASARRAVEQLNDTILDDRMIIVRLVSAVCVV